MNLLVAANTAGDSQGRDWPLVHLVWMHLLAVRQMKAAQELKASAVVFETTLPSQVSLGLGIQEEVWAHFPAALRELRHVFPRAHHVAAKQWECPLVVSQKMLIQNVLAIHTEASLPFLVLATLIFLDLENSLSPDQEKQLFVDQGMDTGFAKHCLASIAEVADDLRDTEEKVLGNDQNQKCQLCVDYRSRE